MEFEFDPVKSRMNKDKHGIDFEEAQALWDDTNIARVAIASATAETRHLFIGKIEGKHWSAVVTYRGESIRLISVRRSRKREIDDYEKDQT